MDASRRIALNSLYTFVGNNITKIMTFVLTIFIARFLQLEEFGRLSFSLGFVALFLILTDWGVRTYIQREIARRKPMVNKYVSNALVLKSALSIITFFIIWIVIVLLGYPSATVQGVLIASLIIIVESFAFIFDAAFNAYEVMKNNVAVKIVRVGSRFLITLPLLFLGFGWIMVLWVFLFAHIVGLCVSFFLYTRKVTSFRFEPDIQAVKELFVKALPFGIATIFIVIYFKIDITMLSKMQGDAAVGVYSAAYGLIDALHFIPIAFTTALAPLTARYFSISKKKLADIYSNAFRYLSYVSIPAALALSMLANKVILLVYGESFIASVEVLQILSWAIPFVFLTYVLGLIMVSMNREKIGMYTTMSVAILNIVLNLILIPRSSYVGAAGATIITEAVLFGIDFIIISYLLKKLNLGSIFAKPAVASALMALAIYLTMQWNLFIQIAIAGIIYLGVMLLTRALDSQEILWLKKLFQGKTE